MYYVSNTDTGLQISRKVKRLKDFKGSEGEQYHVRQKADVGRLESIRIYTYTDGKLKATNNWSVFGLIFGSL